MRTLTNNELSKISAGTLTDFFSDIIPQVPLSDSQMANVGGLALTLILDVAFTAPLASMGFLNTYMDKHLYSPIFKIIGTAVAFTIINSATQGSK